MISKLSAKYQFCSIRTADTRDGKLTMLVGEVAMLVGEVEDLRKMMESLKRMVTGQGLEEKRGETGDQEASLEEAEGEGKGEERRREDTRKQFHR